MTTEQERMDYICAEIKEANDADGIDPQITATMLEMLRSGLMETKRGESGEWYFKSTDLGKRVLQEYLDNLKQEADDV